MAEVIIAGGGIGGMTAAVALQRLGIDAQVYEAAPELAAVGAGIWIPPNAMAVLHRLELGDDVTRAGVPLYRAEGRDLTAGVLQVLDGDELRSRWGAPILSIRRSALQQILAAALRPGSLHLGRRFAGFRQEKSGVQVQFADGSGVEGSLLVGADGIDSAVRRQLFPGVSVRYSGQTCFRGLSALALEAPLDRTSWEVWGGRTRFGFSSTRAGEVYWFAPMVSEPGRTVPAAALRGWLLEQYRAYPETVLAIIAATPTERIIQTDLYDFPPIPRWSAGRVTLLGDAAHAMTPNLGQGGAQAVEDALSLALKVQAFGASERALAEYERVRRPRAERLVKLSWRFGQIAHLENPFLRAGRNFAIRSAPKRLQQRQMDQLFTPRV